MRIEHADHRNDPAAWARALGISREAVDLYLGSEVIDLHVDTFIWTRVLGYDLRKRHGRGPFGGWFLGQADLPRLLEAGVTGATWVITTNPVGPATRRERAFARNLRRLLDVLASVEQQVAVVKSAAEYRAARAAGKHGAFIGIQGGNALDARPDSVEVLADGTVLRVTLVHLSTSSLGVSSAPGSGADRGLTDAGREYVRRLNAMNVFVDLAHVSKRSFWDAVEVHDRSKPLLVTHTGVCGVHPHWRNLDDDQLRAIADSGGTIGIMYQSSFLGDPTWGGRASSIADHLEHVVKTVGEDHASLGSDWDGAIVPPRDMPTCLELPRLAQLLLDRAWTPDRIRKILGGNFLRTVQALRG